MLGTDRCCFDSQEGDNIRLNEINWEDFMDMIEFVISLKKYKS